MIEPIGDNPVQAAHMEAAVLLAEAVALATRLGFTLAASGGTVDVIRWTGEPLVQAFIATSETYFEAEYLTNLIDWLTGVDFGRSNVGL